MSISKKLRFDVFKRDLFACQYCGNSPPAVVLEVDHIVPVSSGGDGVINNLITSCFDCNRGKGARELTTITRPLLEISGELKEKEAQLKAHKKLLEKIKSRENAEIFEIESVFQKYFPDHTFKDRFKESIRCCFLPRLPHPQLTGNMHKACAMRSENPDYAIKYFCGICWGQIKNDGRQTRRSWS